MNHADDVADGSLTFVIPVRDAEGVSDWLGAMDLLRVTIASCLAQDAGGHPRVAIGASRDDPLPEIPSGVVVGFVDHRWAPLPDEPQERMAAIRRDKGLRVAAALRAAQPRGHVMVVDWDDLVSPRLAAWVSAHPRAHGWYGESAYVFNEGPLALRIPAGAHRLFGSTIIQRWDLARAPAPDGDVDPAWADQVYGSHVMSVGLHAQSGTPLEPLPFDVGAYRVGTGQNVSGFDSPFRVVRAALGVPRRRWPLLVRPRRQVRRFGPARSGGRGCRSSGQGRRRVTLSRISRRSS